MVVKKPRIVIIGAGMAGLTAANRLHTATASRDLFELCVVEGGARIGGRINTSEFGGDRIEMGATWIHGIGGSPIHRIAQEIRSLQSETPWECMDGCPEESPGLTTVAEGGLLLEPSVTDPVARLFKALMEYSQGKKKQPKAAEPEEGFYRSLAAKASSGGGAPLLSVGSFLRRGLDAYLGGSAEEGGRFGNWSGRSLEEAVFAMHENTLRTYTSAGDLGSLDYGAESEYVMFPGEEITIAKGYLSVIESLASVLPPGVVQLGRKVTKIEWQPQAENGNGGCCGGGGGSRRPVKLHFSDGSVMSADHAIVTVSLGVLKAAVRDYDGGGGGGGGGGSGMFCPPLPPFKAEAISRLGFGVVNKLFVEVSETTAPAPAHGRGFPFLQMVFHSPQSEARHKKIPWWMRRTSTLFPIYSNSRVLLSWFAGEEALALESLSDEEIISGVSTTVSSFLCQRSQRPNGSGSRKLCNGSVSSKENEVRFSRALRSKWGTDPLFLGSYSYVAVGSSGDDLDTVAEPLPRGSGGCQTHPCGASSSSSSSTSSSSSPLQILFAGEATHRTHYSTTHGAYLSGLREANRLLQHYHCVGIYND